METISSTNPPTSSLADLKVNVSKLRKSWMSWIKRMFHHISMELPLKTLYQSFSGLTDIHTNVLMIPPIGHHQDHAM